ncbi:MAG: flagellar biosynthesis protein FlhA [Acidobacteria bacterium]|nr:flagellar biosynthesis protein FlhA [Acidobacteriota bacterium]
MTPTKPRSLTLASLARNSDLVLPIGVVVILLVMIIPLPTVLLDLLISLNVSLSIIMLLVGMYVLDPVEFSVFPSLLLLVTLFRLSLNLASTRLILLHGGEGTTAAGKVIQSFGQFVVGGNYVVGIVVFIVLVVIQYVVINHGAVRISEVTARFTLDAMPGKQLSIDADLNAGIINEVEARTRREQLTAEAEFYGAMDGAIRFTQRDAVASILIIIINITGGFVIGVVQQGLDLLQAVQTYTILTVGDGLVTAVPSLLISVAGGIITTRAASDSNLGDDISRQLFINYRPIMIGAGILTALALIPGLPTFSFLTLAAIMGAIAYVSYRRAEARKLATENADAAKQRAAKSPEKVEALLRVNPLALEVGYGLIPLVDPNRESTFVDRIKLIRRQLAMDLGIIVPPIHITDNLQLTFRSYAILLKGVEIARGDLMIDDYLAINPGTAQAELDGIETREPTFGLPAKWIKPTDREHAQLSGYTVVDAQTVLATHLTETIKKHAYELIGRQETQVLLDTVAESHPKVMEELVPKALSVGEVQKVLQNLVRERVSIRDLVTILETLADYAPATRNIGLLTEYVRQAIGRSLCKSYQNERGELQVLVMSPDIEKVVTDALTHTEQGSYLALDPAMAREIIQRVKHVADTAFPTSGGQPIVLCAATIRQYVHQLLERYLPNIMVFSHNEIPSYVNVVPIGTVK